AAPGWASLGRRAPRGSRPPRDPSGTAGCWRCWRPLTPRGLRAPGPSPTASRPRGSSPAGAWWPSTRRSSPWGATSTSPATAWALPPTWGGHQGEPDRRALRRPGRRAPLGAEVGQGLHPRRVRGQAQERGMGDLAHPSKVRALAQAHDLRPSRHLGQNFLVDENIVRKIIAAAHLNGTETVVEVGPGFGAL